MKNSIIKFAEAVKLPDENPHGPPAVHIWQEGNRIRTSIHPAVEIITGSVSPWYMDQFDIPGWIEWQGGFREVGFELTADLSLTLFWRCGIWSKPDCFVCIERPDRETWVWANEHIAGRIFEEGFRQVPVSFDANRMRSATSSPTSAIRRTRAVTHIGHTAPITAPGWDFASISAPCFN